MSTNIDNRKDILLLLLYSPGKTVEFNEPIVGRTRLIKQLFLFREEVLKSFKKGLDINEENFYEFFAWDFGPFSREVYDDITFFVLRGFVDSQSSSEEMLPESAEEWAAWMNMSTSFEGEDDAETVSEYSEESYKLTDKGVAFAKAMYDSLSKEQKNLLKAFKDKTQRVALRALLKYVYENYPPFTKRSKIKDAII